MLPASHYQRPIHSPVQYSLRSYASPKSWRRCIRPRFPMTFDLFAFRRSGSSAPAAFRTKNSALGGNFVFGWDSVAIPRLGDSKVTKLIASVLSNLVDCEILNKFQTTSKPPTLGSIAAAGSVVIPENSTEGFAAFASAICWPAFTTSAFFAAISSSTAVITTDLWFSCPLLNSGHFSLPTQYLHQKRPRILHPFLTPSINS